MADTKKEWANKSLGEKIAQIAVNVLVIGIALFATAFFYWIPQPCDIDKQYMYCCTHPGTVMDIVGMILLWFGCFWLSGIWAYFVQDDDEDPWKTVSTVAWLCAVAGPLLIILF